MSHGQWVTVVYGLSFWLMGVLGMLGGLWLAGRR
jgi:hypothetical protein